MYYGAGLLSTIDRYPERRVSKAVVPPTPITTRGRRGRPAERSTKNAQKPKRSRAADNRNESNDVVRILFARLL